MLPTKGGAPPPLAFAPGKKKRINFVAIGLNIIVPWLWFCALFSALSFSFHYNNPSYSWFCVAFGAVLCLISGGLAYRAKRSADRNPAW